MPNKPPERLMATHTCPVCARQHRVPLVLDRLAYGRQLTCSPHCKRLFAAMARSRLLAGRLSV